MATKKEQLSKANANSIASLLQEFSFGDFMRSMCTFLRGKSAAVDPYNLATVVVIKLPDDAKAAVIHRATGKTGTTTGEFTPVAYGTTPSTTQCAVTPCGDIAFLGTDAPATLDVVYQPEKGDVQSFTLPVSSNAAAIPAPYASRVILLLEAEVLTGTDPGKKIVQVPSGSAAGTNSARLDIAKTNVKFDSADAATSARVKLLLAPAVDVDALFSAEAKY